MPKPKLTDEQRRAKTVRKAKGDVYASLLLFLLSISLICIFISDRYSPHHKFTIYDVLIPCAGLVYAAFGIANAKYTIRTNGDERWSPGALIALFLFLSSQIAGDISKHGLPRHWPWVFGAMAIASASVMIFCVMKIRQIRSARRTLQNRAG